MDESESVADWDEQWLTDWCNEPGIPDDERETRAWLAEGWRGHTLEEVMQWWKDRDERCVFRGMTVAEFNVSGEVRNDVTLYKGTLHALPVWRVFLAYRCAGEQVPEFVLLKFEQWARRLVTLPRQSVLGFASCFSKRWMSAVSPPATCAISWKPKSGFW